MKEGMEDRRPASQRPHSITLDSRTRAQVSGVSDVLSFNEQEVVLATDEGDITLIGEGLHIARLNLDEGQLLLEGEITAMEYGQLQHARKGGSFLSRMFR